MKFKRKIIGALSIIMTISLIGCSKPSKKPEEVNVSDKKYEQLLEEAKGTTVNFYGYGGNEVMNKWFDTYIIPQMKEKYDITLKRVGMNIDEILNSLLSDKQANNLKGNMDVVWINGENFKTAKDSNLLLGKFTEKLPNFNKYVDTASKDITTDFGTTVENMEAPWGKAQFTIVENASKVDKEIKNTNDLKEVIMKNPGKFTYPAPPDFTGSAFVRNVIYDIVGYENVKDLPADETKVKKVIQPAINYLKEIKPYLWNKGKTYPSTTSQLDNMYSDEEVYFTMTYSPNVIPSKIESKEFSPDTKIIEFEKGNISNTHFLTVPFNTQNQAGAMVLIDYLMSIDAQGSKTFSKNWGDSTILDMNKIPKSEKGKFSDEMIVIENAVPELRADLVPIIEKIWTKEVLESEQ
ncbi:MULTISPECIES: ABC transporter substrate-binding protein [unclassified Romboutsia]|uniref:ABC transporter substrate-binding protein n=1 Tax=unclassified Romboutsia TaxID=2626894 RepID=UPI0018987069|nr:MULTISPECIES: ABC transporter substrate-binding protein [unclassified Romboutsia]MDB8805129.1 ABC transporter substrate-binding protein [Romboutsia sp. 1001216sp1]MDB8808708.1 ABC transporter substrate-binding protein [Romboutsia sp. 1001216sp1]MDB8810774.1 ABC transporter substrate-binding protein [Romboutsia sp. 1001216sp1]MDB8816494.1 ABC transporter substrate-binding protein [Romboutsia sp. 1001216sp1]MDB8820120.1 ABC transporter substrate-binding protein [Romboutsia sp. 1001216sp1]